MIVAEIKEHIDKVFATKEDVANSKVEIIKWLVGIALALGGLIIAAAKFIK